jgi:hypothetical protein
MLEKSTLWNRAKTVLTTMILITASLTVYFSIYLKTYALTPTPTGAENSGYSPMLSPEFFVPMAGQEVSLAEAQASVPFKIQLPSNTGGRGDVVQVKLYQSVVFIVFAANKLPSDASLADIYLLGDNGTLLTEESLSQAWGSLQNMEDIQKAVIKQNGGQTQAITINGYFGTAGGNIARCVVWGTETTCYRLEASLNCPLQQLIEIARSIPVN